MVTLLLPFSIIKGSQNTVYKRVDNTYRVLSRNVYKIDNLYCLQTQAPDHITEYLEIFSTVIYVIHTYTLNPFLIRKLFLILSKKKRGGSNCASKEREATRITLIRNRSDKLSLAVGVE